MIPYNRQTIDEDDIQAVVDVLRSDFLTRGPKVPEFEKALCDYTGARHAVVFSSATTALYALLKLLSGRSVTTSAYTFAATVNAANAAEKQINLSDVAEDFNLDSTKLIPADIVIAVDFAGKPCDYQALREKHKGIIVADAAHSFGAKGVGTLADYTVLSFHPVKTITSGEGGAVLTNDDITAEYLRLYRNHGMNKDRDQKFLGNNYHMTDFQAALGISQLKKIDRFVAKRRHLAQIYKEQLPDLVTIPENSSFHLLPIRLKNRDRVKAELEKLGIYAQTHYKPVYHHTYYQNLSEGNPLPITERLAAEELSLPLFPSLSVEQVHYICKAIRRVRE